MSSPTPTVFRVGDRVAIRGTGIAEAEVVRVLPARVIVRVRRDLATWNESLSKRQVRRLPAAPAKGRR